MKLTKETTIYKKGAIIADINDAAAGAKNYMTDLGNGVFVFPKGSPNDPTSPNANGILIRDDIDVIRSGKTIASFGKDLRFTTDDSKPQTVVDQNGLKIVKKVENNELISASFEIKEVDGENESIITLGQSGKGQTIIESTKISFKNDSDNDVPLWIGKENDDEDGNWEIYGETMHIENMLHFGDFAWIKRDNGNMTLKWIGEQLEE